MESCEKTLQLCTLRTQFVEHWASTAMSDTALLLFS